MGNPELEPVPSEVPGSGAVDAPAIVVCCCGHGPEWHFGGPDLTVEGLAALRLAHPGGDGGMCRASVGFFAGGGSRVERCDCFNLCDCHYIARDIRSDGTDVCAALALAITERDWNFPCKLP